MKLLYWTQKNLIRFCLCSFHWFPNSSENTKNGQSDKKMMETRMNIICLPFFSNDALYLVFLYHEENKGTKQYNELSKEIKEEKRMNIFKKKLNQWIKEKIKL